MRYVFLFFILVVRLGEGQVPQNPNQTVNGKRDGKWTVLYDASWKETGSTAQASYYRTIEYKQGKPYGTARDFHLNGQLQWQGQLLSDNPDVNEGVCVWYDAKGERQRESVYKDGKREGKELLYQNGKKYAEGTYTADIKNLDWIYYDADYDSYFMSAVQEYRLKHFDKAEPLYKKAAQLLSKTNGNTAQARQDLNWWLYYLYHDTGRDDEAAVAISAALRISDEVKDNYGKQLLQDAEAMADQLKQAKKYNTARSLYLLAVRKRERLQWLEGAAYYQDLKGILDISYWIDKHDSMQYYFEKISNVLPIQERQLATHLNDWAGYTLARKEYDRTSVIEKKCEEYLKYKEQNKQKDAGYAEAWLAYGRLADAKGQQERALKSFADARAALNAEEQQRLYLRALELSVLSYNSSRKYDARAAQVFADYEQWNDRFASYLGKTYYDNMVDVVKYASNIGDFARAERVTLKMLPVGEKEYGKESVEYKGMVVLLQGFYEKQGKTQQAAALKPNFTAADEQKLINAMGVNDAGADLKVFSKALEQGRFLEAVKVFEKNAELFRNHYASRKDYEGLITMNMGMVACYQQVGNWYKAGELALSSKKLADEKLNTATSIGTYMIVVMGVGDFYLATGRYADADETYYAGMKLLDVNRTVVNKKENEELYYTLMARLANAFVKEGYFKDAEYRYMDVMNYRYDNDGPNSLGYAYATLALADLYQRMKYFAQSVEKYEGVMPVLKKELGEQSMPYVDAARTLANIYLLQGNYAAAEAPYLKAKEMYRTGLGMKSDRYLGTLADLGLLYTYAHQWDKADAIYNEQVATLLDQVKNLFPSLSEKEKTSFYALARAQFNTYNVFAMQRLSTNAMEAAEMYNLQLVSKSLLFKSTDRVRRTVFASKDDSLKNMYSRWQTSKEQLAKIYQLSVEAKKTANVDERLLEKKVNDLEKELTRKSEAFASQLTDVPDWKTIRDRLKPGEAAIEMVRIVEALPENSFSYIGKGITIDTLDKEGYARVYDLPDRSAANRAGLRIGETLLEINGVSTKGKSIKAVIEMLKADAAKITLRKKNSKATYVVTLKSDSVFYRAYPKKIRYLALIITPSSRMQPDYVVLPNGDDLETKYVRYYKNTMQQQIADSYSYRFFWQPMEQALAGVKKIYFSPDGVYNSINPNTLFNTATQRYVFDEVELVQVSNTADILAPALASSSRKAVLIGFPDYNQASRVNASAVANSDYSILRKDSTQRFLNGNTVNELPGTKIEVTAIEELLKKSKMEVTSYLFASASEESIKQVQSPRILHIATHGFFLDQLSEGGQQGRAITGVDNSKLAENPLLRSGLLLAGAGKTITEGHGAAQQEDGILTAYEALNLNLNQTDMVVLSACETGLGQVQTGEGVYGLQRAFRAAGAQSVLMSLWKVDDTATQQLLTGFYAEWMKQGSKPGAFRTAQQKLRAQFAHPYYWGAFVMTGQ